MKTFAVSFYGPVMGEDGKIETKYMGTNQVDMKPRDPMTVSTKAFRQATPLQQMATKTKVKFLKKW